MKVIEEGFKPEWTRLDNLKHDFNCNHRAELLEYAKTGKQ